jgi:two-component system sensor histidine kinase YesM
MFAWITSSLQWKLIFMISAIISLVVTSIGTFSYYKSSNAINGDVERFSMQVMKQANIHLSRYIGDSENFFHTVAASEEIRMWAKAKESYNRLAAYTAMDTRFIDPFVKYHNELLSVAFYHENGNQALYRSEKNRDTFLRINYSLGNESYVKDKSELDGFQRLVLLSDDYVNANAQKKEVPILRLINRQVYDGETVYLAIDLSLQFLQDILNQIQLGENGYAMIVDDDKIITSPLLERFLTKLEPKLYDAVRSGSTGSFYLPASREMLVYSQIPDNNWKVVVVVPYQNLAKSISEVRNWTIMMTVAGLIVAIMFVILVSKSITKRLKELQRTIKKTKIGNFDVRVDVKGSDEVAELAASYNLLLNRIDSSLAEITESRIVQQKAVMSALQSQIHSHFFYNALESINSMAHIAGHKEIRRTTVALSSMLRYTSDYKHSLVTVEHELKHLKDYLSIMQNVYRDAIEYRIDAESDVLQAECLKAVLQPFVENSIKHGFERTGKKLVIRVHAFRMSDRLIRIDITDNGPGLPQEKLVALQSALSKDDTDQSFNQLSNVGVLNVCYRMKTYYPGGAASITMELAEGGGLKVMLQYPYRRKDEQL